jgi:hypothetical protein
MMSQSFSLDSANNFFFNPEMKNTSEHGELEGRERKKNG